jgi:hypothetical protein
VKSPFVFDGAVDFRLDPNGVAPATSCSKGPFLSAPEKEPEVELALV